MRNATLLQSVTFLRSVLVFALLVSGILALAACGNDKPDAGQDLVDKTGPDVWLISVGDRKPSVIKAVREITGLGLADAKALVERAPVLVKKASDSAEALALQKTLVDAGAGVEIRGGATIR